MTVGDKGQIVIPARARKLFHIAPGDRLVVLGDEAQGLAVMKAEAFLEMAAQIRDALEEQKKEYKEVFYQIVEE